MKKLWEQIKKFYDAYKIIIFLLPLFGGVVYDRFINMWNVPTKLEQYKQEFTEQRKKDSIMFVDHLVTCQQLKAIQDVHETQISNIQKKIDKQKTIQPKQAVRSQIIQQPNFKTIK